MQRIIFFDGVCPLCNAFVAFVLKRDKLHHFLFAPLQSDRAKSLLPNQDLGLSTFILYENGEISRKSKGVLRALFALGGGWTILAMLLSIFPLFLRDSIYDLVARHRYRLFGRSDICRIPTAEEKLYFLE